MRYLDSNQTFITMIGRLSPIEARQVRRRVKGNKRRLFDLIRSEKNCDNARIAEYFPELSSGEIATLRIKLQSAVAWEVSLLRRSRTIYGKIERLIAEADGYTQLDFHLLALRALRKALALAVGFRIGAYYTQIIHLLDFIMGRISDKQLGKLLNPIRRDLENLVSMQNEEDIAKTAVQAALAIKDLPASSRTSSIASLARQVRSFQTLQSPKAKMLMARAEWLLATYRRDHALAMHIQSEAIGLFMEFSYLKFDRWALDCFDAACQAKSIFLVLLKDYQSCQKLITFYESFLLQNGLEPSLKFEVLKTKLSLNIARGTMARKELLNLIEQLQIRISNNPGIVINHASVHFLVLEILIVGRELEKAKVWRSFLQTVVTSSDLPQTDVIRAYIYELFLFSGLEEWSEVELCMRRIRHFSRTKHVDIEFVKALVDCFRTISKMVPRKKENILQTFKSILTDEIRYSFPSYFEKLDFDALIKAI